MMLNPTADTSGMDSVKKIEAFAMATKMDGEIMRDAIYSMTSQAGPSSPMTLDVLKLSSSGTIVASRWHVNHAGQCQNAGHRSRSGALAMLQPYLKPFADQGLGLEQFKKAFGPESGFVLDWPTGAMAPAPLVMLDVQDDAVAKEIPRYGLDSAGRHIYPKQGGQGLAL